MANRHIHCSTSTARASPPTRPRDPHVASDPSVVRCASPCPGRPPRRSPRALAPSSRSRLRHGGGCEIPPARARAAAPVPGPRSALGVRPRSARPAKDDLDFDLDVDEDDDYPGMSFRGGSGPPARDPAGGGRWRRLTSHRPGSRRRRRARRVRLLPTGATPTFRRTATDWTSAERRRRRWSEARRILAATTDSAAADARAQVSAGAAAMTVLGALPRRRTSSRTVDTPGSRTTRTGTSRSTRR